MNRQQEGVSIGPDEKLEDLQRCNLKIIQSKNTFRFGFDAVLLADFATVKKGDRVLDLGTGNGIIPLLLAGKKEPALIHGLEIQPRLVDMAQRSVAINGLEGLIKIIPGDLRCPPAQLLAGKYDLVVSNPPYLPAGGKLNPCLELAIARHEILCSLADVIKTGAQMARFRGRLALIHRPGRLVDLLGILRQQGLEPKVIRFVHSTIKSPPAMVMVEAVKGGRPHVQVLPPLAIYDQEGQYTADIMDIYNE
ncbi:MAG: tRNA1(Val) (adenine(37)-N6)-methyltransferase [bacterium]